MANKRFNQITRVVTSFDSNDVLPIGNGTLGDGKMSKDTLLTLTAQNALAGNVAQAFDSSKPYAIGESVVNDGLFGVYTENHSAGSWNEKEVAAIHEALAASSILSITPVSLTGVATESDEGSIVRHDIYTDGKTKVYVKVPSVAWSVSYVLYRYCFTCGYVDGDNVAHDVVTATSSTLSSQIGKTIELPSGYSQYYVCMRGNTGAVATFNFVKLEPLEDKIKNLSKLITREFSLDVTGADSTETVVQWPCYGIAKFSVKMPSAYNASNLGAYNTAFAVGYYEVVKEEGEPRTVLVNLNKTQVQSYLDKTIEVNIPSAAKSVFLFARCNTGTTLHFTAKLVQNNYDESSAIADEVRSIELDYAATKTDETSYRNRIAALKYNFVDLRSSDLQEGDAALSDFPSGMKHKSSLSITAKPVARDVAGRTASNGMCISSDGKILVVHAAPGTYIFGVGDLYNDSFAGFTKSLYVGGSIHANYMWFGSTKYAESDPYPLLYVGGLVGGDGVGSTINVLRIVGNLESAATCSFTLVQTITIDSSYGPIADVQKWGNKLVAWYNEYIYVFDSFPAHTAGNVTLTGGTAYEFDGYTFRDPPQSGCIVGDSLYEIAGYGNSCYIVVIDLTNKTCKQIKMPSYGEWETLCYFNDLFFAMTIANDTNLVETELVVCSLEFTL